MKAAIKRFCPLGNGGTEGGVKTIEGELSLLRLSRARTVSTDG